MSSLNEGTVPPANKGKSHLGTFLHKLRKRRIIETLAAFIGGGWLLVEVVERLLVSHYDLPERLIDITVVSVVGALLATLVWRWFRSAENQPGNLKLEILLVPLLILSTAAIDFAILLGIFDISGKTLLVAAVAVGLGIAWIILKSLQWAAAATPQPPGPFATSEEPKSPISVTPEKSIVVLPFANISPEEGQEYFCDGMTEEIITDLSHVRELLVISRSSAMTFKGTKRTIPEIARAVNVRYVLEGSVRKAGKDLRITAQLIDAATDAHIWAEKYSGTLDDVFDIQEKVSRSVVESLKLRLTSKETGRMAERPIGNVAAYEYYLRAYPEILNGTEQTLGRALRYLQKALDIVGDNALIYAYMAFANWMYVNIGARQEDYLTKAEECVRKSLALDPTLAKAHVILGWIRLISPGGKLETGLRHFKKGLELSPEESWALQGIADVYIFAGKISAAASLSERLLKLDPLDFHTNWIHAGLPLFDGRFDEAANRWLKLYEMFSEYPQAQFYTALALAYCRKNAQAFEVIDKSASLNPDNIEVKLGLMLKFALQGDRESAQRIFAPNFRGACQRDVSYSYSLADIFAILDEKEKALDWLENAVGRGFINYPFLAERDPFLANIRVEVRFKKLMERVKYEWDHFEV
jgi:non-specific serine/threonine protein kinase